MHRRKVAAPLAAVIASALALAACSSDSGTKNASAGSAVQSGSPLDLRGVCPDPIVFQKDWQPESEHGVLYNLLGPGYTVDTNKKKVAGPLVAQGVNTGVKIEIRTGGPAIGFQEVPAVMYLDKSINIGFVSTDQAVGYSQGQPTLAVMAPLDISPLAVMWDPKTYPQFNTISDIGQTSTKVLYTQGLTYMEYLVGSGILRRSQLDGSYIGRPTCSSRPAARTPCRASPRPSPTSTKRRSRRGAGRCATSWSMTPATRSTSPPSPSGPPTSSSSPPA